MAVASALPTAPPRLTRPRRHRAGFDAAVRTLAGAVLWLSLVLVAYWWSAGGGIGDLSGWQSGLTSAGRLTGLVASVLLLAQVILMARVPLLESAFGQDRLARVHRIVGFTSFDLMVAHIVLITWGYAAGRLAAAPGTLWNITIIYPGMLLAAAGTVCLVMVVVTSVKAARRQLRYESWHLLHLYAYLGVGLALPHQLWTGQEFMSSPGRTVFWWTAWGSAAGAIVVWRLGLPVWRNLRHQLRVTSVVPEGDGAVSVYLTGRRLDRLDVTAGQFMTWRFLDGPGWTRANPYSLSAAPGAHGLRITAKALGDGSAALHQLRPGTRAIFEGPFGRLSARTRTRDKVVMIGAGVGITPLRALVEGLDYSHGDASLIYRFTDEPLFGPELEWLARERGLRVMWLPGPRRGGGSWLPDTVGPADDPSVLLYWLPDLADHDVYICGPDAWAGAVRRTVDALGVPEEQVHVESFRW